jgi:hypothetical protein
MSDRDAACGRCGKDPADGLATINGVRYCHPDHTSGSGHPEDCYSLAQWEGLDR